MAERDIETYIGDAVYAKLTPDGLELTTRNGYAVTNIIILEWQPIWTNLMSVVTEYQKRLKKEREYL